MDIQYQGEHLLPGQIGQFFVILSFVSALFSTVSYYYSVKAGQPLDQQKWKRFARIGFWVNLISVVGIGSCLFYIIYNHLFEYHYAWAHSSRTLPVYYIISSFWEGQEGSFWLWTFWQVVLGSILVFRAKGWESPVMSVLMFCQAFLASMLLGVEVLGERVGSSPFILLREAMNFPILSRPDYLTLITDGNGLNPLLQNYWMVIHPPVLFLGFASMIVPFAYGFAGLWLKKYKQWIKPVMPWALFAVMTLGTGIIMGSFWAYEALNFGGFWAWDPVENASIIPWFTLIAAVHVLVAYKNSGHSYFIAALLTMISFVLVVYASFLTRSGILGETSVHAFTDLGMFWQLVIFNVAFLGLMVWVLVSRWKEMPRTKKDEETYSREFWLFIGSMVLFVACIQIVASTSIPVYNAIFGTDIAPPVEVIAHYNKWQVPFAIIIALLSGISQFLKYKKTQIRKFYISVISALIVALVVTAVVVIFTGIYHQLMYILLCFAGVYAMVANGKILGEAFGGKWKLAGSAVAHIGFGMLLIGALIAAAKQEVVSINRSGMIAVEGFEESTEDPGENLFLYENEPVEMGPYTLTYVGDSIEGVDVYYKVNYVRQDASGNIKERFQLTPRAQQNPKMGLVGTPSTKHYLHKDIYTIVTAAPRIESLLDEEAHDHEGHDEFEDYEAPSTHQVNLGDTIPYRSGYVVVKEINRNATVQNIPVKEGDLAVGMTLEVHAKSGGTYTAVPLYLLKDGRVFDFPQGVVEQGLKFRFTRIDPDANTLELQMYQKPAPEKKYIVMKAISFPFINLFWGGTIIMVIGFLLAITRRNKEIKPADQQISG